VSVTRDNYRAHTNLGFALADTRAFTPAVEEYREAPQAGFAQAHNYLGVTLAERGDHAQAGLVRAAPAAGRASSRPTTIWA
jgi:hypothetical protein